MLLSNSHLLHYLQSSSHDLIGLFSKLIKDVRGSYWYHLSYLNSHQS